LDAPVAQRQTELNVSCNGSLGEYRWFGGLHDLQNSASSIVMARPATITKSPAVAPVKIREFTVHANETALNQALQERGIEPDQILSVMLLPGRAMAIGDYLPKYRVIYWVR
jgi:hypothetical protein